MARSLLSSRRASVRRFRGVFMKKSVLAALVGTLIAAPALAQSYDPAAQGALATDFIYGYFTGATFTQLVAPANYATGSGCYISTGAASSCLQAGGSSPFLGLYFTPTDGTSSGANLYASDVTFHPGGNGELAALAFVAPTAGDYRFTRLLPRRRRAFGQWRDLHHPWRTERHARRPPELVHLRYRPAPCPRETRPSSPSATTAATPTTRPGCSSTSPPFRNPRPGA